VNFPEVIVAGLAPSRPGEPQAAASLSWHRRNGLRFELGPYRVVPDIGGVKHFGRNQS
jgi:hypothetical protein